jgi:hypothetical protein
MKKRPEIDRDRSLTCQGRERGDGKKEDHRQQEKSLSDHHSLDGMLTLRLPSTNAGFAQG